MASVLASSAVDREFESWSGQIRDYKIGTCCFSTQNQDNVSQWGNMSIRGLLFQWASNIEIQLSMLV